MYDNVIKNLKQQLTNQELEEITKHNLHLGIFSPTYLISILNGEKTIESRFSKNRILPYNKIKKDDIVIMKKSSGDIIAYFTIKEVLFFDLKVHSVEKIKKQYNAQLCVDDAFWEAKKNSNYATLIFIDKVVKLKPFHIAKKGMQTWLKLN